VAGVSAAVLSTAMVSVGIRCKQHRRGLRCARDLRWLLEVQDSTGRTNY